MMRVMAAAIAALLLQLTTGATAYAQVARVLRIDGAAMVDIVGQPRRILGIGEQLEDKAVITVAKESFVMLEFRDETRVTLRPNTVFQVENFADQGPESVRFGLTKGGLRAVSGLIGKRRPEAVRINAATGWIGIRGTEFDVRLCQQDCDAEERAVATPSSSRTAPAARVVEIEGIAVASGPTLPSRALTPGSMVYERDSVATAPGGYVTLAFADGSRTSLGSDSVLAIHQFRFDRARPEQAVALLRLYEGGVRVLTGGIAQRTPEAYRIETAIGPVDPRGTLFDVFCSGACVDAKSNARAEMLRMKEQADRAAARANTDAGVSPVVAAPQAGPVPAAKDGLVVHTIEGTVLASSGGEAVQVQKGATAAFSERGAAPRFPAQPLRYIVENKAPRPDLVTVDSSLFQEQKTQGREPGLYVWVREGSITLNAFDQRAEAPSDAPPVRLAAAPATTTDVLTPLPKGAGPVVVQAGQAAFVGPRQVLLLPNVPTFMRLDTTPLPTRANVPVNLPFFQGRDGSALGSCTTP